VLLIQTYHHGRFEFFVVMIVIVIIAMTAFGRYSLMAEEARILRLQTLSHHFMTGAANIRIQYLLAKITNKEDGRQQLDIGGKTFHFSAQGWPVSASGPVGDNYQPTDEDCYQLWQFALQNPAPITKGEFAESDGDYRVFAAANNCRYEFTNGAAYFDYLPLDGRLLFAQGN
jgi:hypothetical protein